jgi:hypothetical protein
MLGCCCSFFAWPARAVGRRWSGEGDDGDDSVALISRGREMTQRSTLAPTSAADRAFSSGAGPSSWPDDVVGGPEVEIVDGRLVSGRGCARALSAAVHVYTCWEVRLVRARGLAVRVGVATRAHDLHAQLSCPATERKAASHSWACDVSALADGDTLLCCLDQSEPSAVLTVLLRGRQLAALTGIPADVYPAVSIGLLGAQLDVNLGGAPMACPIPFGHVPLAEAAEARTD